MTRGPRIGHGYLGPSNGPTQNGADKIKQFVSMALRLRISRTAETTATGFPRAGFTVSGKGRCLGRASAIPNKKENPNGAHSVDHIGVVGAWCRARVAVQPRVGILPQRRTRLDIDHHFNPRADAKDLTHKEERSESMNRIATHPQPSSPSAKTDGAACGVSRQKLIDLLNEDLAREYQAVIAYVVYSQILKGAAYMNIAGELENHAAQELEHALIVAKQIDYLGGTPTVQPKSVKLSEDPKELLRFDLDNEIETIRNYRERVKQCETLGEFAIAEHLRRLLVQEQDHAIDLSTALGINVPEVTS
jgi:bacterioferritin